MLEDVCHQEQIDAFQPYLPIAPASSCLQMHPVEKVTGLRNAGMRDRHWKQVGCQARCSLVAFGTEVSELVGKDVTPQMEDFTLKNFVSMGGDRFFF